MGEWLILLFSSYPLLDIYRKSGYEGLLAKDTTLNKKSNASFNSTSKVTFKTVYSFQLKKRIVERRERFRIESRKIFSN